MIPLVCLLAVAGCGHHRPRPPRATRPNVVFVLTDDLSTDLLSHLPAVRRLQREGTTFTNYFVSDSLCCPSRASIFTGRLPHNTGVFTNVAPDGGLYAYMRHHDSLLSFARPLRERGYRTALMGKYLNGYAASQGVVPRGWTDWAATAKGYLEFDYTLNDNGLPTFYGAQPKDYLTDVIAARGARFIGTSAAAGRSFFLELATFAPHRPAIPAPRDAARFPYARAPRTPAFDRQLVHAPSWLAHRAPLSRAVIARIDRDYRHRARSVLAVNRLLGTIERELQRTGQARNTYVIFSSDNGYHLGEHRLYPGKLTAFDTDIRVPLVVAGPGVPAGSRVGAVTQNTDLAPTFDALAGVRPPPGVDGRSLLPLLRGRAPRDWRRFALVEHHHPRHSHRDPDRQPGLSGDPPTYVALRSRSHTYVEYTHHADRSEYYDDVTDPFQLRNRYPGLSRRGRERLHRRLVALTHCHGAAACATSRRR